MTKPTFKLKCQHCGAMCTFEIAHKEFTLYCSECVKVVHEQYVPTVQETAPNVNQELTKCVVLCVSIILILSAFVVLFYGQLLLAGSLGIIGAIISSKAK